MSENSLIREGASKVTAWGRFVGIFWSIIFIILSCVGIYYGWKLWHQEPTYTESVESTITNVSCNKVVSYKSDSDGTSSTITSYTCILDVEYYIEEVLHSGTIRVENLKSNDEYNVGDKLTILYKPDNPNNITISESDYSATCKLVFGISLAAFFIFIIIAVSHYYFDALAFGTGTTSMFNIFDWDWGWLNIFNWFK